MAERTVKVNLVAQVSGYIAGMEKAARKTRDLGSEAERLAAKRQAFEDLGRPLLAFGAIAAAAVGIAIKKFADFDAAMSQVNAVTQETASNLDLLRDAALDAGGATVFTALEAANAIEELGKAGISTADILDGALSGALSLAASGQLEVARAAEITATTLKQFGLAGTEAGHVADVLSAGAGKALGSVEDLAQALKFVGPVAASMGISLEETTGALALFADQGLIGEQAGTSLRGVLSSLTSPSSEAAKEIERLGIKLYDSQGAFLGVQNTAGQLDMAFTSLTDKQRDLSLGLIFGNQQVTAARVLFQGGADAVGKYTDEVNDAGYAARVAADRMDNLKGDVEKLGGAFDTFLIKSGSGANDVLRTITQSLTFLVDEAGKLPEPVLGAGLAIGTVAAAVALTGGAALLAVPRLFAFKLALAETSISAKTASLAIAGVGGAIGIATIAISTMIAQQADLAATGDALVDSLDKTTGAFTDYSREIIAKKLQDTGAAKTAKELGISLDTLTNAAFGNADAIEEVRRKTEEFKRSGEFNPFGEASIQNIGRMNGALELLGVEIKQAPEELKELKGATDTTGDSYLDAANKVAAMDAQLNSLIDTINKANGVGQDAVSTNAAYQQTIVDTRTAVEEFAAANGVSVANIDQTTAAGSANADMFADLAQKAQDAAKAQLEVDGNTDAYLSTLESGRQALYDQIVALTGNADAAQLLTDKIFAMPTLKEIQVIAETTEAQRRLDAIRNTLDQIASRNLVLGAASTRGDGNASANGNMFAYANGGVGEGIYSGGAPLYKFAEPETKWEAFISGRPGQESRNRMIWAEAGERLGVPAGQVAGSSKTVNMNVSAEDPAASSERVFQRLNAELMKL